MGYGSSVIGPTPSFPVFYFLTFIFSAAALVQAAFAADSLSVKLKFKPRRNSRQKVNHGRHGYDLD